MASCQQKLQPLIEVPSLAHGSLAEGSQRNKHLNLCFFSFIFASAHSIDSTQLKARAHRCYPYSIVHIPHSPTSEQVESESERGKGEIISILSDLCFSAFFTGFISSLSSSCVGIVFNHWLFSLKVFFLGDLTFSHFLIPTKTLLVLSGTSALSLAGLAFRCSCKTKIKTGHVEIGNSISLSI